MGILSSDIISFSVENSPIVLKNSTLIVLVIVSDVVDGVSLNRSSRSQLRLEQIVGKSGLLGVISKHVNDCLLCFLWVLHIHLIAIIIVPVALASYHGN